MDSGLSKKLVYPEYATYVSHKLNKAPAVNDNPPDGTVYQWETMANGVIYVNVKSHDGTVQSYPLEPEGMQNEFTPQEIDDSYEFTALDVVDNALALDKQYVIADISFYTDVAKEESQVVQLPIVLTQSGTRINFDEVDPSDYQYGGKIRFSRGVVYLFSEDTTRVVPTASGEITLDVSLGYTYVISNIGNDVYIKRDNITNLPPNKLFKIVVENTTAYKVYVDDTISSYGKFFVCYMNLNGSIVQMGNIIQIN